MWWALFTVRHCFDVQLCRVFFHHTPHAVLGGIGADGFAHYFYPTPGNIVEITIVIEGHNFFFQKTVDGFGIGFWKPQLGGLIEILIVRDTYDQRITSRHAFRRLPRQDLGGSID